MLQESIDKSKAISKLQRENFRKAVLAGTRQAFGTDGGVYPHSDNGKQFPLMVEFGLKRIDAIRAATVDAAELLGLQNRVGVVAPKAFADIIEEPTTIRSGTFANVLGDVSELYTWLS
jgi:imidazolonepropionase-like amidohydrolase